MGTIVLTTTDAINFAMLAARKGALALELKGLKRRGQSAYSICKEAYGLKGNRESVYQQMCQLVEEAIAAKQAQNG